MTTRDWLDTYRRCGADRGPRRGAVYHMGDGAVSDVLMKALQLQVESLTRQVQQLAPENERVRQLLTDFTERHLADERRIAAALARAERAEAERDQLRQVAAHETDCAMAAAEEIKRLQALLKEAVEALRPFGEPEIDAPAMTDDRPYTALWLTIGDFRRARATLARIQGDSHE